MPAPTPPNRGFKSSKSALDVPTQQQHSPPPVYVSLHRARPHQAPPSLPSTKCPTKCPSPPAPTLTPGSPAESLPNALGAYCMQFRLAVSRLLTLTASGLNERLESPTQAPTRHPEESAGLAAPRSGPIAWRLSAQLGNPPKTPAAHAARCSSRVEPEPWHQPHTRRRGDGPPPETPGNPVRCHTACYTVVALSYIRNACPFLVDPASPSARSPLWPWASALPERTPAPATQGQRARALGAPKPAP